MNYRVGCPSCGTVVDAFNGYICECECDLLPLDTAAEKLAFHLSREGRQDEATAVLDNHSQMQEHGPC